jgi:hypothetical protein
VTNPNKLGEKETPLIIYLPEILTAERLFSDVFKCLTISIMALL